MKLALCQEAIPGWPTMWMISAPMERTSGSPLAQALPVLLRHRGRDLAKALSQYCAEVRHTLPRNTLREDDWMQGEMKATDYSRLKRLMASAEYGRWQLVQTFDQCWISQLRLSKARPYHR